MFSITLHSVSKLHTNRIIRSLLKSHVVKTKHIKIRRDIDELFVSSEHSVKCSYKVLTRHHRYVEILNEIPSPSNKSQNLAYVAPIHCMFVVFIFRPPTVTAAMVYLC